MKASIFGVLGGQGGTMFIPSGTDYNGQELVALITIQDSVFTQFEESNKQGSGSVSDVTDVKIVSEQNVTTSTVPAGAIFYPKRDLFTRVHLASGSAIALRK